VLNGLSSGTTSLPSRALAIGALSFWAMSKSSSVAPRAPLPARMTGWRLPWNSAARSLEIDAHWNANRGLIAGSGVALHVHFGARLDC
jgi:hypothetical protein